jgi:hypothetical protein
MPVCNSVTTPQNGWGQSHSSLGHVRHIHRSRTVGKYALKCVTGISGCSKEPTQKSHSAPHNEGGSCPQFRLWTQNSNRSVVLESVWGLWRELWAREVPKWHPIPALEWTDCNHTAGLRVLCWKFREFCLRHTLSAGSVAALGCFTPATH